jgi:capsular exopolysaccharide synthesis family protein
MQNHLQPDPRLAAYGSYGLDQIQSSVNAGGSGLSEILGSVRRRKWVLIGTVVAVMAVGSIILTQLTPRYTAEAMVLIETQEPNISSLESVVAGLPGDAASVQSEAYILNSRNLAHRVIDKLGLINDPEFNETHDRDVATLADDLDPLVPGEALESHLVTENFHERLAVKPQINSRVIAVSFVSVDPSKARLITNTLLDEYILSRLEAKYESTKRANSWLGERIAELRENVENSESEVELLRQQYGLIDGGGVSLSTQELAETNTQLIMSRTDRAAAQARLRELKRMINSPGGINAAGNLLESPLIQSLREQQADLQRAYAELSSEYGVKHPRMIKLAAESQDVQKNIEDEVNKIISGLENEVSVAKAREQALQANVSNLKSDVSDANQNLIKVRMFEREVEADRALLSTLLSRQKETLSQEDFDFQQADARIISYADIPVEPSFPNVVATLALLLIGSTCLGLFLILFIELLDHGVHSGEELAEQTGVKSLGFAPYSSAIKDGKTLAAFAAVRATVFGQAIKSLNWGIRLGFPDDSPPKTIMVTSSVPFEGKSTIASCLAFNSAATGAKVLLIDADLRRPTVNKIAGIVNGAGLIGFLEGKAGFADVIIEHEQEGLSVIPAGSNNNYDSESLVSSTLMRQLLEHAAVHYDCVIIDTPPVMACADAKILGSKVDATVFVVRWDSTKRAVVKSAIDQLQMAGAHLAGTFLSMVNIKQYSTYHYGDAGAYAGDMGKYYAQAPVETRDAKDKAGHQPDAEAQLA